MNDNDSHTLTDREGLTHRVRTIYSTLAMVTGQWGTKCGRRFNRSPHEWRGLIDDGKEVSCLQCIAADF